MSLNYLEKEIKELIDKRLLKLQDEIEYLQVCLEDLQKTFDNIDSDSGINHSINTEIKSLFSKYKTTHMPKSEKENSL